MSGPPDADADAVLRQLWQDYIAAWEARMALPDHLPNQDVEPYWEQQEGFRDQIIATPANSVAGLYIKLRLFAALDPMGGEDREGSVMRSGVLPDDELGFVNADLLSGLLADAGRLAGVVR